MKKIFTLACGLFIAASFASAQTTSPKWMVVTNSSGSMSAFKTSDVDNVAFSDPLTDLLTVTTNADYSTYGPSISGSGTVTTNSKYTTLASAIEVGVCYSSTNSEPTKSDSYVKLGTEQKDYTFSLKNLEVTTQYYYRLCATFLDEVYYGEVATATSGSNTYVIDKYEGVDLGLPSGLLWATSYLDDPSNGTNATGDLFAWAETTTKEDFYIYNVKYWNDNDLTYTLYTIDDGRTTLASGDDAATQLRGDSWRMPTKADYEELIANCNLEWTSGLNGDGETAEGIKFTSKLNGESIFMPVDSNGDIYLWTSTVDSEEYDCENAYYFNGYKSGTNAYTTFQNESRYMGHLILPVAKK